MAYYNKRVIRHQVESFTFTISPGERQNIQVPLTLLGIRGQIRRVCVRAAPTTVTGSFDTWIYDRNDVEGTPITTFVPPDELIYYVNETTIVVGSDTDAMINDGGPIGGGGGGAGAFPSGRTSPQGDYEVDPVQAPTPANLSLLLSLRTTPAGFPINSDITFFVTIWSEVQL